MANGLLVGVAVAGFAILVGLGRAAILLLRGGTIAPLTPEDVLTLVFYVLGFAGAGILVALVWPLLKTPLATYAAFALAGTVLVGIIMYAVAGRQPLDALELGIVAILGSAFGCAFAYGWLRHGGPPAA